MSINNKNAICICTFRRPKALITLLNDIQKQDKVSAILIIVDGDPKSGAILGELSRASDSFFAEIVYIPSVHANLAFQRSLGWEYSRRRGFEKLLYLDDDLRIINSAAIITLFTGLDIPGVVGVTSEIIYAEVGWELKSEKPPINKKKDLSRKTNSSNYSNGGYVPTGHRVAAKQLSDEKYCEVSWMYGPVMLYTVNALEPKDFSLDLFSLSEIGYGRGEDTYLSRRLLPKGKIIYFFNVGIIHPMDSPSYFNVKDPFHRERSLAYSRRFLNDNYRILDKPTVTDRLYLLRSYIWNNFSRFLQIFKMLNQTSIKIFTGYFVGSMMGLFIQPRSERLTPKIDWLGDVEMSLRSSKLVERKNKSS